jgi:hypothetical protein
MLRKGLLILILFAFEHIHAQRDSVELEDGTMLYNLPKKRPTKNALFIELGGNAGMYSLNYDRILINKPGFRTSVRGGFSLMPFTTDAVADLIFVAEHNFLIGKEKHFIETGPGITYVRSYALDTKKHISSQWLGALRLGYRFQERLDEGLFFRAGLTPYLVQTNESDQPEGIFQFWFGVGAGANF